MDLVIESIGIHSNECRETHHIILFNNKNEPYVHNSCNNYKPTFVNIHYGPAIKYTEILTIIKKLELFINYTENIDIYEYDNNTGIVRYGGLKSFKKSKEF